MTIGGGRVVDPANGVDAVRDVALADGRVDEVGESIAPAHGDWVVDAAGLVVAPGLIEVHVHLRDLFEVTTRPILEAVASGTTLAISPGAGNTLMAPSLLGAEVDRGVPLHIGLLLGAPAVLGTAASLDELIAFFRGELDEETALQKLSRNAITARTGNLIVGVKDHMGHFIQTDEGLEKTCELADKAGLLLMSHTQDPDHAERLVDVARGRGVHLAHVTAGGFGTHGDAVESLRRCIDLCRRPNVTGEFLTPALRPGLGNRDGVLIDAGAQQLAYDALRDGVIDVLTSDGQCDATMKGFGDTRENIFCLVELVDEGILTVAGEPLPHRGALAPGGARCGVSDREWPPVILGPGALAASPSDHRVRSPTPVRARIAPLRSSGTTLNGNPPTNASLRSAADDSCAAAWTHKAATFTIVGGEIAAFEGRALRASSR
ncbi:MAG: amidohydrolase family protein [Solirubrobacterales bacterium]|nr:amidohydrolase family protein [Solirubrobacterales bacterium]